MKNSIPLLFIILYFSCNDVNSRNIRPDISDEAYSNSKNMRLTRSHSTERPQISFENISPRRKQYQANSIFVKGLPLVPIHRHDVIRLIDSKSEASKNESEPGGDSASNDSAATIVILPSPGNVFNSDNFGGGDLFRSPLDPTPAQPGFPHSDEEDPSHSLDQISYRIYKSN